MPIFEIPIFFLPIFDESGKQKQEEDFFEAPSLMTLVTESEGSKVWPIDSDTNNKHNAETLKSGWIQIKPTKEKQSKKQKQESSNILASIQKQDSLKA